MGLTLYNVGLAVSRQETVVGRGVEARAFTTQVILAWRTELVATAISYINVLGILVEGREGMATTGVKASTGTGTLHHLIHLHDSRPCRCQREEGGDVRSELNHFVSPMSDSRQEKGKRKICNMKKRGNDLQGRIHFSLEMGHEVNICACDLVPRPACNSPSGDVRPQ